jgi:hypothetical protein
MRKGEIIQIGDLTISHRLKPDCLDKLVWDNDEGDWVVLDPEESLSDEILVKWPQYGPTGNPY